MAYVYRKSVRNIVKNGVNRYGLETTPGSGQTVPIPPAAQPTREPLLITAEQSRTNQTKSTRKRVAPAEHHEQNTAAATTLVTGEGCTAFCPTQGPPVAPFRNKCSRFQVHLWRRWQHATETASTPMCHSQAIQWHGRTFSCRWRACSDRLSAHEHFKLVRYAYDIPTKGEVESMIKPAHPTFQG